MKDYLEKRREELKKREAKGFTLMEMLIVVAIIAVLIAIAIPVFTSQLEKSRDTTSVANIRSAYALAQAAYLSEAEDANVTIAKKGNKITSVTVSDVQFEGVQTGWSGATDNLPNNVNWDKLTDKLGGDAGAKDLTFAYADDGTITLSKVAASA